MLVLVLSALGGATATAAAPPHKPLPQSSCAKLTALARADVPGVDFQSVVFVYPTNGYLSCYWSIDGLQEAFSLLVRSGKSKTASAQTFATAYRRELTVSQSGICPVPSQAYLDAHQNDPGGVVGPPWSEPVMTTVAGHPAWVEDSCVTPDPGTPLWNPSTTNLPHEIQVLDGNMIVTATWYALRVDKTAAQVIPFVARAVAKYAPVYGK